MALGRVVPWADWEEWERVRTGIFSDDSKLRRAAVDMVNAWEARGKLPLGAEITACLHELHMKDHGFSSIAGATRQHASEPEALLRLQYAMLVIRLVNGISDSSQKGRVAMSVANLAEDAGIPRILVDVRHDASHNELPSLALLRLASSAALSWLSSAYWQRQADHLQSCRAHIRSLLQRYIDLQRAAILKQAVTGKAEEEDSAEGDAAAAQAGASAYSGAIGQKQRREVVAEIWERVHAAAHLLVGPLLDDGLLEAQEDASNASAEGGSSKLTSEQVAAAVWEAVVQGLSGTWPHLRQLLLAAAVQRLCTPCPSSAAKPENTWPQSKEAAEIEVAGGMSRPDSLAQWVGWVLGVAREDGQKKSRQQKVGAKRKSSQVDSDNAGQREQWKPSLGQLNSLLASCLRALTHIRGMESDQLAQRRADALRRVAMMLLERTKATNGGRTPAQSEHLQRLVEVSTRDAGGADAAPGGNSGRKALSEALLAAETAQKELIQRAAAAAVATMTDPNKKHRWCVAENWAPCALGMLPSPHHPCGRLPTLDAAPSQGPGPPTAEPAPVATSEEDRVAMNLPGLGILKDLELMDTSLAEGEKGGTPVEVMEVQDYFSRFETQCSNGMEEIEAQARTGLTTDEIQSIAGAIKVL